MWNFHNYQPILVRFLFKKTEFVLFQTQFTLLTPYRSIFFITGRFEFNNETLLSMKNERLDSSSIDYEDIIIKTSCPYTKVSLSGRRRE